MSGFNELLKPLDRVFQQMGVPYNLTYFVDGARHTMRYDPLPGNGLGLAFAVLLLEAYLWPEAKDCLELRQIADNLAADFWTKERARLVVAARAAGTCECGCGSPLGKAFQLHHGYFQSQYAGAFKHHPVNLFALKTACHDRIHREGKTGFANMRMKRAVRQNLPSWWKTAKGQTRVPVPSKFGQKDGGLVCPKCNRTLGNRQTIGGYHRHCWKAEV